MKANALTYILGVTLTLASCNIVDPNDNPSATSMKDLRIPAEFSYKTSDLVDLSVVVRNESMALSKVPISVYLDNPGTPEEPNPDARKAGTFASDGDGRINIGLNIPLTVEKVYLKTDYIGLESLVEIPVVGGSASYIYGSGTSTLKSGVKNNPQSGGLKAGVTFSYMGTYTSSGVPNYLEGTRDEITQSFLDDLNATLPESKKLTQSHPDYLANGNEGDIVLKEEADIWITFVHEGAGYTNALGYYLYEQGNPPKVVSDIKQYNVIFPNVSYSGSGGGLKSGDKVYIGRFKAGMALGWFLVPNGWSGGKVSGSKVYYSEPSFNPEVSASFKQHNVLVYDSKRGRLLLGFEDLNRESGSDEDFNDAVFYITANPVKAVDISRVPPMDTPSDKDKDGISDTFDDYPEDPTLAFNYFYPAENQFGSLVVEDLWPGLGDFDFNDLVVDYQFQQKADPQNKVREMSIKLKTRAIGASFRNGFGIQLPLTPQSIKSVTGYNIKGDYVKLLSNGVEANQSKAVVIAFEDSYDVLPYAGSGTGVNVESGKGYTEPQIQEINVVFSSPLSLATLGQAPFNPFLIIDGNRGKEIHMSGYTPTDLASQDYFGKSQDASNPAKGWYYRTQDNLVWMLEVPTSFDYMSERQDLVKGHLKFSSWAESGGSKDADWYVDKPGNREASLIYKK
jgi:LruC domain-containing protein